MIGPFEEARVEPEIRYCCPHCGGSELSAEHDIIILFDIVTKEKAITSLDFADELTGLSFVCMNCGSKIGVTGVNVILDNNEVIEY